MRYSALTINTGLIKTMNHKAQQNYGQLQAAASMLRQIENIVTTIDYTNSDTHEPLILAKKALMNAIEKIQSAAWHEREPLA